MRPISDFVTQMDTAEKKLKQTVLEAFKAIDEAKVAFIETYNTAQIAMETEVASREQRLRETVAQAVDALNGDPKPNEGEKPTPMPAA